MSMPSDTTSIGRLRLARASGSVGVGKYRIFASLGRGGMADVQLAAAQGPKGFTKLVVVKRLRPLLADDAAVVNMFLDEARLDARLNHPNLIHTYEFGEEQGTYFIAMEFVEGQPLHEILHTLRMSSSRRNVSPGIWAKIVADALAGLHYAHELRDYDGTPLHIVHRDVSPQNIVVTYDGGVKLVDFGIAKATVNASKTESHIIKGKLAYMAPEQADPPSGGTLDRRADVFAMGIVLWECLAQKRLATGDARSVVSKIVDMEFQPPSTLNPDVPLELDEITKRALERAPADRYQTAQAMRDALERFLHTQGDIVDESAVGTLVSDLFAREREDIQRQIRVQMLESGSSGDLTVADLTPSERMEKAARDSGDAEEPALPRLGPSTPLTESVGSLRAVRRSTPADGSRGLGWRGVAVGVAALLLFVAAVLTLRESSGAKGGPATSRASAPPIVGSEPPLKPERAEANGEAKDVGGAASVERPEPAPTAISADAGGVASPSAPVRAKAGAPPARPSSPHDRPPKLDADPWAR
jgi:serine/threonine protein kinase